MNQATQQDSLKRSLQTLVALDLHAPHNGHGTIEVSQDGSTITTTFSQGPRAKRNAYDAAKILINAGLFDQEVALPPYNSLSDSFPLKLTDALTIGRNEADNIFLCATGLHAESSRTKINAAVEAAFNKIQQNDIQRIEARDRARADIQRESVPPISTTPRDATAVQEYLVQRLEEAFPESNPTVKYSPQTQSIINKSEFAITFEDATSANKKQYADFFKKYARKYTDRFSMRVWKRQRHHWLLRIWNPRPTAWGYPKKRSRAFPEKPIAINRKSRAVLTHNLVHGQCWNTL